MADDVNYARMVEYDARHELGRLEGFVCASSRPLLVASVAGSLGEWQRRPAFCGLYHALATSRLHVLLIATLHIAQCAYTEPTRSCSASATGDCYAPPRTPPSV